MIYSDFRNITGTTLCIK